MFAFYTTSLLKLGMNAYGDGREDVDDGAVAGVQHRRGGRWLAALFLLPTQASRRPNWG
jgi:hypothetical protein